MELSVGFSTLTAKLHADTSNINWIIELSNRCPQSKLLIKCTTFLRYRHKNCFGTYATWRVLKPRMKSSIICGQQMWHIYIPSHPFFSENKNYATRRKECFNESDDEKCADYCVPLIASVFSNRRTSIYASFINLNICDKLQQRDAARWVQSCRMKDRISSNIVLLN